MAPSLFKKSYAIVFVGSRFTPSPPQRTALRRQTPYGLIQITYLQSFREAFSFHKEFPPFEPYHYPSPITRQAVRCRPGQCSHPTEPMPFAQGLHDLVPRLKPTHVIANSGWTVKDISCDLQKLEQTGGVKVAFISHPATRGQRAATDRSQWACSIPVLDRETITLNAPDSFYWDDAHVLSAANQEFNYQLLDMICD